MLSEIGEGHLEGSVEVDQAYAQYQELTDHLRHPLGGKAHALGDSLYLNSDRYMQTLADNAITEEGSDLESAMADNMEHLSGEYYVHAPWEFGDLRGSGHPTVTSDGDTVYDRPPNIHRLSPEELREKAELKRLFGFGGDFG